MGSDSLSSSRKTKANLIFNTHVLGEKKTKTPQQSKAWGLIYSSAKKNLRYEQNRNPKQCNSRPPKLTLRGSIISKEEERLTSLGKSATWPFEESGCPGGRFVMGRLAPVSGHVRKAYSFPKPSNLILIICLLLAPATYDMHSI